jgi:aspartyl-tRNA(Asn)/glutamyl-tRNA(Gln) amidotransferase subunit C
LHSDADTAFRLTWVCPARADERQAGPATRAWGPRGVKPASGSQLGFSLVSQISRDEVAHLARLARLALTDIELDSFAGQLDAILTHVSQIQAVDCTGVEPTDNPLKQVNVTRPDETTPCLTQQEALAEAPEAVAGRFAVPQILGESQ